MVARAMMYQQNLSRFLCRDEHRLKYFVLMPAAMQESARAPTTTIAPSEAETVYNRSAARTR
jgi:hypothetical protein